MSTRSYVKYVAHTENLGQGAARNSGLGVASGEFIMFIDVDDSFETDYIEHMLRTINRHNADLAYCNSVWQYPERDELHNMFKSSPDTKYKLLTGREALDNYFNLYKGDFWIPTEPWGKIIRRSFLDTNGIAVPRVIFEDVIMNFHELVMAKRVALSGEYLYLYNRKNLSSAIESRKKQYIRELYRVPEKINEFLNNRDLMNEYQDHALRIFFRFIRDAYDYFAKGSSFPEEFRSAIKKYLNFLPTSDFSGNEAYIIAQLRGFRNNLRHYAMSSEEYLFYLPFKKFIAEQTLVNPQKPASLATLMKFRNEMMPSASAELKENCIGDGAYQDAMTHNFKQLKKPSLITRAWGKVFLISYQKSVIKSSGAFNLEYYQNENPEVSETDLIDHYVRIGWREGRNPSPWFNTIRYLELHRDIKKADINPFIHYLLYGAREGRRL